GVARVVTQGGGEVQRARPVAAGEGLLRVDGGGEAVLAEGGDLVGLEAASLGVGGEARGDLVLAGRRARVEGVRRGLGRRAEDLVDDGLELGEALAKRGLGALQL